MCVRVNVRVRVCGAHLCECYSGGRWNAVCVPAVWRDRPSLYTFIWAASGVAQEVERVDC